VARRRGNQNLSFRSTKRVESDVHHIFVRYEEVGLGVIHFLCLYTRHRPVSKLYPCTVRAQDTDWPEITPVLCLYTRHRPARNDIRLLFVHKTQTVLEVIPMLCSYTRHRLYSK